MANRHRYGDPDPKLVGMDIQPKGSNGQRSEARIPKIVGFSNLRSRPLRRQLPACPDVRALAEDVRRSARSATSHAQFTDGQE